jgi:hypothetical protein
MTANRQTSAQTESSNGQQKHPLAEVHLKASDRGHWWNRHGADAPDWYEAKRPTVKSATSGNALTSQVAPDVPDTVEWDEYVSYNCVICRDPCLNRRDSEAGEKQQCWKCATVPE